MPRLAELHLGQGVGVEMLEGPEAGRQEVDLLIAACPSLTRVRQGPYRSLHLGPYTSL